MSSPSRRARAVRVWPLPVSRTRLLALLCLVPACRGTDGLDPEVLGFKTSPPTVVYGRVLEGDSKSLPVTITSLTRADQELTLTASDPFSVQATVTVPGGATVDVPVTFHAGRSVTEGLLRLRGPNGESLVPLAATGVHPLDCAPSKKCVTSKYSLELDRCVETNEPDGTACEPDSICLEKGTCRAGACEGVPRACDDKDACTDDGCSPDVGCVHTAKVCPTPANPCHAASCSAATGCGEMNAPDGTTCGSVDCVTAHLCVSGGCGAYAAPEGFVCAPATPCRGESHCHNQQCVPPDAGFLAPKEVVPLDEVPVGPLLAEQGNVYFTVCAPQLLAPAAPDAGPADAGDAGVADGGADAGLLDAGALDAGPPRDAGCALVSYTFNGIDRWRAELGLDGGALVHVTAEGVGVLRGGVLELRSRTTGAVRLTTALAPLSPRAVAAQGRALFFLTRTDAGLALARLEDAGTTLVPLPFAAQALALDQAGTPWFLDGEGSALLVPLSDGGVRPVGLDAGAADLCVAEGAAVAGPEHVLLTDGGLVHLAFDAGERGLEPALAGGGAGVAFFRQCPEPLSSCLAGDEALWVHAFSLDDGRVLWRAAVAPKAELARVVDAELLVQGAGSVLTVSNQRDDAGGHAYLDAYARGQQVLRCEFLPDTELLGAVAVPGRLVATVRHDAGVTLETFELRPLEPAGSAWPRFHGVGGSRAAR